MILNAKPRALECSDQGNLLTFRTQFFVFFHFRTHSRHVVVVREVADREVEE